jgi:hypothetical protein
LLLDGLLPGFLLDRSGTGVDLQMVPNHLPRYPRHLRWLPYKHVYIDLKEDDEREFLFTVQITCNAGGLGGICSDLYVFTGTSSPPEGCTRGADDKPHWSELEGSWSQLSSPAAASCWAARA